MEERLKESENRYRHLVESSQGLICTHDTESCLLSVNPDAARALSCEAGEMIGRSLREFLIPVARGQLDRYLGRVR